MANPQPDKYTKISNELLDALIRYRIPGEQMQVFLFIMRKTYGYNKKQDAIALSQFVDATGIKKANVSRAIKGLLSKKIIIIKKDNGIAHVYEIIKDYEKWEPLSKKITIIKKDNLPLSKKSTTKDNTTKDSKDLCDSSESPDQQTLFDEIILPVKQIPKCPQQEIVNLWAEIMPELPQPKEWGPDRQTNLRARWNEKKERQDIEWWEKFLKWMRGSEFFMGKKPPSNGHKQFVGRLDWLIQRKKFIAALEGQYHE